MEKTIKLKPPIIGEWIFSDEEKIGLKQDGLSNSNVKKFHISELTLKEAEQYSESYKDEFIKKYNELKK